MSESKPLQDRLAPYLMALEAGDMSDEQLDEFRSLLREDAAARQFVAHYMTLAANLEWDTDPQQLAVDSIETAVESQPSANPALLIAPRPQSWLQWASRHPKGPAVAVALAVLVMVVVGMAVTPVKRWMAGDDKKPEGRQPEAPMPSEFVAILNSRLNDEWTGSRPPLSDPRLRIGHKLSLKSGTIEVKYFTGARVVIEGPAEFVVGLKDEGGRRKDEKGESKAHPSSFILHPSNTGYLAFGSLVARVEGEDAQGFTIDTPFARVEDLGTEFHVDVLQGGAANVVVLSGEVDCIRDAADGKPSQRVRLTKEQGALLRDGSITRHDTVDPQLVAAFRKQLDTKFTTHSSAEALVLRAISSSGRRYRLLPGGFVEGATIFTDREYTWNSIDGEFPAELQRADLIQVANDDKDETNLTVRVEFSRPGHLYLFLRDGQEAPKWLTRDFERTELKLKLGDPQRGASSRVVSEYFVWRQAVDAGETVELGGAAVPVSAGMYGLAAAPITKAGE